LGQHFKTYEGKHLFGAGAVAFHTKYVERFRRAASPQGKMLAIDRLIHAYHWELVQAPGRSAARELIYASNYEDLLWFLDAPTYGERSTPGFHGSQAGMGPQAHRLVPTPRTRLRRESTDRLTRNRPVSIRLS